MDGRLARRCLVVLYLSSSSSSSSLMFLLLMLTISKTCLAQVNFNNSPKCFHDNLRVCGDDRFIPCESSVGDIKCIVRDSNLSTLAAAVVNSERLIVWDDTVYISNSVFCYPYLRLRWEVDQDLLLETRHFLVEIAYGFLGEKRLISKLMAINNPSEAVKTTTTAANGRNIETSTRKMRFYYSCHQVAYPGVRYRVSVSALGRNHAILATSGRDVSSDCEIKFGNNPALDIRYVDDNWVPNVRLEVGLEVGLASVRLFFTAPGINMNFASLRVSLSHVDDRTNVFSRRIDLTERTCPYTDAITITNLTAGVYSLKFFTLRSTAIHGKEILRKSLEIPSNLMTGVGNARGVTNAMSIQRPIVVANSPRNNTSAASLDRNTKGPVVVSMEFLLDGDFWKAKVWIFVGVATVLLWTMTVFIFCTRLKSSTAREIDVCLKGSPRKRNLSGNSTSSAGNVDSGIPCSSCSHSCSNSPVKRCHPCSCHPNDCREFLSFDFHPPSVDGFSISSFEFSEKIKSFNLESEDF